MMSTKTTVVKIAVIGAGPGGLAIAKILQRKQQLLHPDKKLGGGIASASAEQSLALDVKIFEAAASVRRDGGSLDIKADSGQLALRDAGVFQQFLSRSRPEGEEMKIIDKDGVCVWEDDGVRPPREEEEGNDIPPQQQEKIQEEEPEAEAGGFNPEIDRRDLQDILMSGLEPDTIQWKHKLVQLEEVNRTTQGGGLDDAAAAGKREPTYCLHFANGSKYNADLVIGADGAWSPVRSYVSSSRPEYSGITFLDCELKDFEQRHPDLVAILGKGTAFALSGGKGLITQWNSGGVLRLYVAVRVPEDWHKTSDVALATTIQDKKNILLEKYFQDWSPTLQDIIKAINDEKDANGELLPDEEVKKCAVMRPIYALPVPHCWPNKPRVTLIGDAAHVMSPFAGEGVNMALADARSLANSIFDSVQNLSFGASETSTKDRLFAALSKAAREYEDEMVVRAAEAAQQSKDNLALFFHREPNDTNVAAEVGKLFSSFGPPQPEEN